MEGLLQRSRGDGRRDPRWLVSHRRRRGRASGWIRRNSRSHEGRDHQRRREYLVGRSRSDAPPSSSGAGGCRCRVAGREWGEAPHAWVVVKPGATIADGELRTFCRARLAHFKVPHSFTSSPSCPKTATGKIQKYVLRGGSLEFPGSRMSGVRDQDVRTSQRQASYRRQFSSAIGCAPGCCHVPSGLTLIGVGRTQQRALVERTGRQLQSDRQAICVKSRTGC